VSQASAEARIRASLAARGFLKRQERRSLTANDGLQNGMLLRSCPFTTAVQYTRECRIDSPITNTNGSAEPV
jgi:hypothetical protein